MVHEAVGYGLSVLLVLCASWGLAAKRQVARVASALAFGMFGKYMRSLLYAATIPLSCGVQDLQGSASASEVHGQCLVCWDRPDTLWHARALNVGVFVPKGASGCTVPGVRTDRTFILGWPGSVRTEQLGRTALAAGGTARPRRGGVRFAERSGLRACMSTQPFGRVRGGTGGRQCMRAHVGLCSLAGLLVCVPVRHLG